MFQNHHVLPVRTSRECVLLFRCFPFHSVILEPWFHFCDLHVLSLQLHQTQRRQAGLRMNGSSNMKKKPAIVYFETHLLKKQIQMFSFTQQMFCLVLVQMKAQKMPKTEVGLKKKTNWTTLANVQACLCLRFTRMEGAKFHLSYRKFQRSIQFLGKLKSASPSLLNYTSLHVY